MPEEGKPRFVIDDLVIDEVAFVARGANPEAHIAIWKSADADPNKENPMDEKLKEATEKIEALEAQAKTVKKANEDAVAKAEADLAAEKTAHTETKTKLEEVEAKVKKSDKPDKDPLPEAVQKVVDDANRRADATEAALAKIEDEKNEAEALAKVAKEIPSAAGDIDSIGKLVHRVTKNSTEDGEALMTLVKSLVAKEKVAALFAEYGTASKGEVDGDPVASATQKAKALQEGDESLSLRDAISKVFETDPALYERYRKSATAAAAKASS